MILIIFETAKCPVYIIFGIYNVVKPISKQYSYPNLQAV